MFGAVLDKIDKLLPKDAEGNFITEQKKSDASISKLEPALTQIGATDRLIDQIVYKLYGLTDEKEEL